MLMIVGEHVQRHFGGDAWQRLHKEMGCSHPRFDCPERMLERLAPLAHFFWMLVEPALHSFENMLMLQRVMRRSLLGVQLCLMAQFGQALVQ